MNQSTTLDDAIKFYERMAKRHTVRLCHDEAPWITALAQLLNVSEGEIIRKCLRQARLLRDCRQNTMK